MSEHIIFAVEITTTLTQKKQIQTFSMEKFHILHFPQLHLCFVLCKNVILKPVIVAKVTKTY